MGATAKDYYALLELAPTASADEIKKAFRAQIAKYHPDKVQHLGQEFQEMAAERAAELTEAYRILSDEKKRATYDESRGASAPTASAPAATAPSATRPATEAYTPPTPQAPAAEEPRPAGGWFSQERATGAAYIKKAMAGRFRAALDAVARDYDAAQVPGFDVACNPKSGFFGRAKGPRLLARYVDRVDAAAIADAWAQAAKVLPADEVCVFLMGSTMAPAGELALAINEQRRRVRGGRVTLIPVDARDWDAKMPTDAPPVAKSLVARLRTGA
jgi:curved DNA-binding protein CbpA